MSIDRELLKASRSAEKLGVTRAYRHILLCADTDTAKCAGAKQMRRSWRYLKERLKELKLEGCGILRTRTACMGICKAGPIAIVMPDGCWYGGCTPKVLERIIQEHVIAGRIVDEYLIARMPEAEALFDGPQVCAGDTTLDGNQPLRVINDTP